MSIEKITPLVSIVMAVKDTAQYLPECLDSIISQTYENWELIAVNDHSVDKSLKILQSYSDKDNRIRVFSSDRPKLIPTLQVGYKEVKGTLILLPAFFAALSTFHMVTYSSSSSSSKL